MRGRKGRYGTRRGRILSRQQLRVRTLVSPAPGASGRNDLRGDARVERDRRSRPRPRGIRCGGYFSGRSWWKKVWRGRAVGGGAMAPRGATAERNKNPLRRTPETISVLSLRLRAIGSRRRLNRKRRNLRTHFRRHLKIERSQRRCQLIEIAPANDRCRYTRVPHNPGNR